jgi:hypothetical protein
MTDTPDEAAWRAEFERIGEQQVTQLVYYTPVPEPKRQFGFKWLGEEAQARRGREEQTYRYVQWTFFAALAAVIVGIVGVIVTLFH